MIQRIQTLYLFVALCLMVMMHLLPVAQALTGSNEVVEFRSSGLYHITDGAILLSAWPIFILINIITLMFIITIIIFKRRLLQIRICVFNILLLLGLIGMMFYYLSYIFKKAEAIEHTYRLAVLSPVISLILTYLAMRNIRKDENLVKSADRIR